MDSLLLRQNGSLRFGVRTLLGLKLCGVDLRSAFQLFFQLCDGCFDCNKG